MIFKIIFATLSKIKVENSFRAHFSKVPPIILPPVLTSSAGAVLITVHVQFLRTNFAGIGPIGNVPSGQGHSGQRKGRGEDRTCSWNSASPFHCAAIAP